MFISTLRISPVTLVVLAAVMAGLVGCGSTPRTSDRDLAVIDHQQLEKYLADKDDRAVLIDVRSHGDFAEAHIPGAVNIPMQDLQARDPRLAEASRVIVYADGWNDILSPAAAKKLIVLGYSGVYDYRGGLELWKTVKGEDAIEAAPAPAESDTP